MESFSVVTNPPYSYLLYVLFVLFVLFELWNVSNSVDVSSLVAKYANVPQNIIDPMRNFKQHSTSSNMY